MEAQVLIHLFGPFILQRERRCLADVVDEEILGGDLDFSDGATYDFEFGPGGLVDLVDVNGVLTIGATATVNVINLGGTLPAPITLFEADSLAGAGNISQWTINGNLPSFYRPEIDGNDIILAVPEPATASLLALALWMVAGRRTNRRR